MKMKLTLECVCGAQTRDNSKERGRFLRRHPFALVGETDANRTEARTHLAVNALYKQIGELKRGIEAETDNEMTGMLKTRVVALRNKINELKEGKA